MVQPFISLSLDGRIIRRNLEIRTDDQLIQTIPEQEFRFLVHWGADIYKDYAELKRALDHSDDLTHEMVFDIFIHDLKSRGIAFQLPNDPLTDKEFIGLLTRTYDLGVPSIFPPEPEETLAA